LPDGCGHAEVHGGGAGSAVDLGEFVFGAGEADLEAFGFAEPAFAFGFGDAGGQVVADFGNGAGTGAGTPGPRPAAALGDDLVDAAGSQRPPVVPAGTKGRVGGKAFDQMAGELKA
jgi:hypothetical protein